MADKNGNEVCTAPGCSRKKYAKNLCNLHYNQVRTHGRLTPELERAEYSSEEQECSENGCHNVTVAKGLCRAHYMQQYRMFEHNDQIEANMTEVAKVHTIKPEIAHKRRRKVTRRRSA